MADIVFVVLLVLHVGTVVAWMGGALVFVSVVFPALRGMPPASRGGFITSVLPRYVNFASASSLATTVTGLVLYWYFTQSAPSLPPSGIGLVSIQVGAVLSLMALVAMFGISRPSSRRLVSLTKQMAVTPNESTSRQMSSLQRRSVVGGLLGVALLGLSLIMMVLGAEL